MNFKESLRRERLNERQNVFAIKEKAEHEEDWELRYDNMKPTVPWKIPKRRFSFFFFAVNFYFFKSEISVFYKP